MKPVWVAEVSVIVKVVVVVPVAGETLIGTFTIAVIEGWIEQWYGKDPAARSVTADDVAPDARLPVFQSESGAFWVELCVAEPPLCQDTVPPCATLTDVGEKKKSPTETVAADAGGAASRTMDRTNAATSTRRMSRPPSFRTVVLRAAPGTGSSDTVSQRCTRS